MPAIETHSTLVIFLSELRKSIRALGLSIMLSTVVIFFLSPEMLRLVQEHLADKLYFFCSRPFPGSCQVGTFCCSLRAYALDHGRDLARHGKAFRSEGKPAFFFILFTCILFYAGTLFCYFVTLPLGIKFLLGFGSADLQPVISIGRFVNFTTIFILAFGVVFELPIFMVFMARVGVFSRSFYEENRRYALLLIAILAALLTPTPDIVNMLLMGGPLYLLYEAGIVILMAMRVR